MRRSTSRESSLLVALVWTTNNCGGKEMDSEVQRKSIAIRLFGYGELLALKWLTAVV
jgi:hypothetical protein